MNTKRLFHRILSSSIPRTRIQQSVRLPIITRPISTSTTWRSSSNNNSKLSNDKTCWQCQSTNKPSALFCENKVCSVIQPIPSHLNFFHLLQVGTGENK